MSFPKQATKTAVYKRITSGMMSQTAFFQWIDQREYKISMQARGKGYAEGVSEGYSSGKHDGRNCIRSNY